MAIKKGSLRFGRGIVSMTGFGRCEKHFPAVNISIEIRSVNNRFFDIGMKIPRELNPIESDIRDCIRSRLNRGRINLLITLERDPTEEDTILVNLKAAEICRHKLSQLNSDLGNSNPVTLDQLLHFSDFFIKVPETSLNETLKGQVLETLDAALNDLTEMRRNEGLNLAKDLSIRLTKMDEIRNAIVSLADDQPNQQMEKIQQRVQQLVSSGPIDPGRLEQELAFLADRLDITEECVRLESHHMRFLEIMAGDEPVGKKLGFLLQEMNREANTISSKSASAEISHLSVLLKEEIERAREQIQNLE